jgi:uncharacterized protein (TIGR02453 family)
MIQAETLSFLQELSENNHKEWFDANRPTYQKVRKNVIATVDLLLEEMVQLDPGLGGIEAKSCLFRINRDVRFSNNKAPYKTNMGASMAKGGKKSPYGGYYLHIQPGSCFLGGGSYQPDSASLKKIRERLDRDANSFRAILESPGFRKHFGEIGGDALKTAPKGFPRDHPDIDLIRMKGFTAIKQIPDSVLTSPDFVPQAVEMLAEIVPFIQWLNEALEE